MAAANIISVIGTGITLLSFLLDSVPSGETEKAKVSYIIANDGANGDLTDAGGDLPDIRHWDETAEFLGATYDPGHCDEGVTTCTTEVNTQQAVTYTLLTGNNNAICIAWTGLSWAGGQQKYGFHPGNWAHACDESGYESGYWYYAGTQVPGIDYQDDVFCAWVDADGDIPTTAFQVHWPEFDGDSTDAQNLDYYCSERPPVDFRTDEDPGDIQYWVQGSSLSAFNNPLFAMASSAVPSPEAKNQKRQPSMRQGQRLAKRFEKDSRIIKSRFGKHLATELCDPSKKAAGHSFVSYSEEKFCYMPTKTIYPFCGTVEDGPCWSDQDNDVIAKGVTAAKAALPDLSHVTNIVVWED